MCYYAGRFLSSLGSDRSKVDNILILKFLHITFYRNCEQFCSSHIITHTHFYLGCETFLNPLYIFSVLQSLKDNGYNKLIITIRKKVCELCWYPKSQILNYYIEKIIKKYTNKS